MPKNRIRKTDREEMGDKKNDMDLLFKTKFFLRHIE